MITLSVNGQDQICAWDCMRTYIGDKLAGRPTAGTIRLSDNLLDIFGRMKLVPAPKWQVNLGLAAPDSKVNTFVAGSMIETIAMGLMATIFSTILAIPISFFAARNIMSRLPGGTVIYYVTRGFLNIVRAIDTIVWGLIVDCLGGSGNFRRCDRPDDSLRGRIGKIILRGDRTYRSRPGRGGHCHRRQPDPDHPLCSHPANCAIIPVLFSPALGYQYALRDSHRFCSRRRHRLFRD